MKSMVDIHCHILPHVDDGADSTKTAIEMLKVESADGVSDCILTPHFFGYSNHDAHVMDEFLSFQKKAKDAVPEITLHLGRELFFSMNLPELLEAGTVQYMASTRYALVEFAPDADFTSVFRGLNHLLQNGVQPILAHVERVRNIGIDECKELVKAGVYLQVNSSSIYGKNGFLSKRKVSKFLSAHLIHFVGSDSHNMITRRPDMGEAYDYTVKKFGTEYADTIFTYNPQKMLENEYL